VGEGGAGATPSFHCCGVRIDVHTPHSAAASLVDRRNEGGRAVHLCNAYTLSLADGDAAYRSMLNQGDLNLADGMPLVWIARALGLDNSRSRVYGPDLMIDVFEQGQSVGLRHFLYGSSPAVLSGLVGELERRYPSALVVGSMSPPFRDLSIDEEAELVGMLIDAQPDVVWIGLGTPKQDRFAAAMKSEVPASFVCVGAAFDFIAGTKRQAPLWMQHHGLEWLFRLAVEPRRLWRRYLVGNLRFLVGVVRQRPALFDAGPARP
jgi:N-acetylglucosaminyldiphosphoundecaprenol N-acetyl-beta-D-mannosaminyltransferase